MIRVRFWLQEQNLETLYKLSSVCIIDTDTYDEVLTPYWLHDTEKELLL